MKNLALKKERKEVNKMLYFYNGKIYVKPYENKIVEVEITKTKDGYDAKPILDNVIIKDNLVNELQSISIEEAYKILHQDNGSNKKKSIDIKDEDF
jgi:hypothetical protein